MATPRETKILAGRPADEFVGRTHEFRQLIEQATAAPENSRGVLLLAAPGAGVSELMRQVYDELFRTEAGPIPIYFALRRSDETADRAARRFLHEFLVQTLGFLRKDPSIVVSSPGRNELLELSQAVTGNWFASAIGLLDESNGISMMKSRLNVGARVSAAARKCFILIDDLHETLRLENGEMFLEEIENLLLRQMTAASAKRKFATGVHAVKTIELNALSQDDSALMVDMIAGSLGVNISEQARDLVSVQFGGRPSLITSFLELAGAENIELQSFRSFGALYARETVLGRIGSHYDDLVKQIISDVNMRRTLIERLYFGMNNQAGSGLNLNVGLPDGVRTDLLSIYEIDAAAVRENEPADHVLRDFVTARYRTLVENRRPSAAVSDLVTETLKRAPRLMAEQYRKAASLGLSDILLKFDCQSIPAGLLDYAVFKSKYKGIPDADVRALIANDPETLDLPQLVHADDAGEYYPPIAQIADADRTVVAIGFIERRYTDDDEVAWLAAEIDSKMEAPRELAEFWLDRLEMVAVASDFPKFKIWLIAPEGFDDDALALLRSRRAFGSSRKQAELLMQYLTTGSPSMPVEADEYEIVVPMGGDTELIAAHAVEEVAKRRNYPTKTINQIKTALVEACINAAEHSLSPDGKIYQKFTVDKNKIVITVSNRGIRMTDRVTTVNEPGTGRRGWGLNLMKGLMDEVKIEQVDDGTRISMTKYVDSVN